MGWIITLILTAAAVAMILIIVGRQRKIKLAETRRMAASRLMKEEILNRMISPSQDNDASRQWHLMVQISWKEGGWQNYVMDPENGIRFGRSAQMNDVIIDYEKVSAHHCMLFLYQGNLYVKDAGSSNGTHLIRHGHRYLVKTMADIRSGDRLDLGGVIFLIRPFWFDASGV